MSAKKGFANIVLIVLVVILVGALGYVTLVKKSAPAEQLQSNNSQNTQTTTSPPGQQTNKENIEYHLSIQGNPSYETVALSDVSKYGISSDNRVTTKGTVVFVESRTDGANSPQLVLKDNSATAEQVSRGGGYVVILVARAFRNEFAPLFSKLKIGDTVQVWGTAGMTQGILRFSDFVDTNGTTIRVPSGAVMIETNEGGIAGAPYFGVISLQGIKKD